jgi:twitching motility protein PilT
MQIQDLLQFTIDNKGSDIHLVAGSPLSVRINGVLSFPAGPTILTKEQVETLVFSLLTPEQKTLLEEQKEIDLAYQFANKGRFRINTYRQMDSYAAAFRLIPDEILSIDELNLPKLFHSFSSYNQGLVLFTGPTGEGKSTSLAAIINEINQTESCHILTIEDPVEFVYKSARSVISQREVGKDTKAWQAALRSALRSDPDVVLVGEMRDFETIALTLTLAETGHLVFATLHTNTAAQTIDRIVDVFPSNQQAQVRQQLSTTLKAVVSQRLVPKIHGGRVAAVELMLNNSAIANLIRENKVYQIDNIIQNSANAGMMLMENHLIDLLNQKIISKETALSKAFRPNELMRLLGN